MLGLEVVLFDPMKEQLVLGLEVVLFDPMKGKLGLGLVLMAETKKAQQEPVLV